MERVVVIGAGVVGLTCAVRLREAGFDAHVLAADLPLETTSAVAGAVWMPHLTAEWDQVGDWARAGLAQYLSETGHESPGAEDTGVRNSAAPDTAVSMAEGLLLDDGDTHTGPPLGPWSRLESLQPPVRGHGMGPYTGAWRIRLPVINTPRYLSALADRLVALGGTVTRMTVAGLPQRGLVVNATGFRARYLADDPSLHPVRGQAVLVRNPGLTNWWVATGGEHPRYAFPRGDICLVGGTHEQGVLDPVPDPGTAEDILAAVATIDHRFAGAQPLGLRAGIRPVRPVPRVELMHEQDRTVVHCYGHGGAGWTLAWGTADTVAGLLASATGRPAATNGR
ncbi:MAG: amino acid oxidase [Micrococcales bacterium]|nr:MAG: amino acid oxidase [Micrococcales bacterium]